MNTGPRLLGIAMILAAAVIGAWLYPSLPEQIPSHWNIHGEVDDSMNKPWGVFFLPLLMLGTMLMFELIVLFSPKGFRVDRYRAVVGIMQTAMLAFMLAIFIAQLLVARGAAIDMPALTMLAVAMLFIVMGNYFGKLGKNFFIGIRTPWTLASDEVWIKTHRLAGRCFVATGFFLLAAVMFELPHEVLVGGIILAAVIPVVYSFLVYRKLEGFDEDRD